MARTLAPAAGLYKNGSRWWIRTVFAPLSGAKKALSTGTTDIARANAVKAMTDTFATNPTQYHWLDKAIAGDVSLDQLATHHAAGTLHLLAEQLKAAQDTEADADLDPWVTKWVAEDLAANTNLDQGTRDNYERQVRFFIPAGVRFGKSQLTEDAVKAKLATLTGARHNKAAKASTSTQRRYVVGLQQFIKYAKKRVPLDTDPLADATWIPANGKPRSTVYEFSKVQECLKYLDGEDRAAIALLFGTGIELGAFLAMKGADVGSNAERTIVAHGTKNGAREDRTIFVDEWAWKIFYPHARTKLSLANVWSYNPSTEGRDLREAFYQAQVKAGLIEAPELNEKTRKLLWGRVAPHSLHDARHSYCVNRTLGLDGEEPQDISYCANQLGHTDETMILKIYKKQNLKERLRTIKLQQQLKAAKAAGGK